MVAIEESDYEEHLKKQGKSLPAKKSSPKPSSTSLAEEKIRSQIPQEDEDVVLDFSNTRLNTNLCNNIKTHPLPDQSLKVCLSKNITTIVAREN